MRPFQRLAINKNKLAKFHIRDRAKYMLKGLIQRYIYIILHSLKQEKTHNELKNKSNIINSK